jgi:hypothetical protein
VKELKSCRNCGLHLAYWSLPLELRLPRQARQEPAWAIRARHQEQARPAHRQQDHSPAELQGRALPELVLLAALRAQALRAPAQVQEFRVQQPRIPEPLRMAPIAQRRRAGRARRQSLLLMQVRAQERLRTAELRTLEHQ